MRTTVGGKKSAGLIDMDGSYGYPDGTFSVGLMKMSKLFVSAVVLLSSLVGSAAAFADVYFYKDSQGVLTFTNVPNHG